MTPEIILRDLRRGFTYRSDGRFDRWQVPPATGPVAGDCEDFALALALRLASGSGWRLAWHLMSGRTIIWQCRSASAGVGHAVLWHRGAGWADNIFPTWAPRTPHRRVFPWLPPLVALKLALNPLLRWGERMLKRANR